MDSGWKNKPAATERFATVRASSLKDALRRARAKYGKEVCIVESRTVLQREPGRLGQQRAVEVLIDQGGIPNLGSTRPEARPQPSLVAQELTSVITTEVARIEKLVQTLADKRSRDVVPEELHDYPLAALLLAAGTSQAAVHQLAETFCTSPSFGEKNLASAMAHLQKALRTGEGDWTSLAGCHLFLGDSGVGKTDLVLAIAARLRRLERNPLVLSVLPAHGGGVRRLQLEAAQNNYDAALIKHVDQLERSLRHLAAYDTVLIDTPGLLTSPLAEAGELQEYLSQNEGIHRHFVVPIDLDFQDAADLWELGRLWNCDWLVLSRMDRSRRRGKILDLLGRLPLPVSFSTCGPWPESEPQIARAEQLVGLIVDSAPGGLAARATA